MQQYIYGNIGHKAYTYVSSEPEFFANAQRAAVLSHLMSYDVFCTHGDLPVDVHQCFWMVTSNLDNPSAPDRLYLQASGGDTHRTGFYVRGYMSDADDGYLYDSRLLTLLRTRFASFEQTMKEATDNQLKRIDCDQLPVEEIQPAVLDPELLRGVLLALMRKKKVIIRIPAVGQEAMRLSRAYILAIYERLPYEQRKVNGFVTGISAAKLRDQNALPASVNLMLMDADADLGGLTSDMFREVFDLAGPDVAIRPMIREGKGKKLAYVDLMDFLAEQSPAVLDDYFRFCRSCMKKGVDGSQLAIQDYSMYLNFFNIGHTEFTDDIIRSWAANIYINARNNEKWTQEVKQVLFDRIVENLPAEKLQNYLCAAVQSFDDLTALGVVSESELKRIRSTGTDMVIQDENIALTLAMTEMLLKHYPEGTRERLEQALTDRFVSLACGKYPCLAEKMPTAATVAALEQIAPVTAAGKTTALAAEVKKQTNRSIHQLREETTARYEEQRRVQYAAGLEQIAQWSGTDREELPALYDRLAAHHQWMDLLLPDAPMSWNGAIADRMVQVCCAQVAITAEECGQSIDYCNRCEYCFLKFNGALTQQQSTALQNMTGGWRFLQELSGEDRDLVEMLGAMECLTPLFQSYPREAREALVKLLFTGFISRAEKTWPCLVEKQPRKATVEAVNALPLPDAQQEAASAGAVIREKISGHLRGMRTALVDTYNDQYENQYREGLARIGRWAQNENTPIAKLYGDLTGLYLWQELLPLSDRPNWNDAIGGRIAEHGIQSAPETVEDYRKLIDWTEESCTYYAENGGTLSPALAEQISKTKQQWHAIVALSQQECTTVAQLLELFDQVNQNPMTTPVVKELKTRFAGLLIRQPLSAEAFFQNWKRLCAGCADPLEKELLTKVADRCRNLNEIPRMPVDKLVVWLKIGCKLQEAGLLNGDVHFQPWKATLPVAVLLTKVTAFESYETGKEEPDLSNKKIRRWVAENLGKNTDLMVVLARDYPTYRQQLIPGLAARADGVSRDQILALYAAGCPRAMLCQGAGADTAQSWQRHMDALFPGWVELPEPIDLVLPSGLEKLNGMLIVHAILLAVAALIPGVAMLVLGIGTLLSSICVAVVLTIAVLVLLISGLMSRKDGVKRFLLVLAGAAAPGMVAAIAGLVINLI